MGVLCILVTIFIWFIATKPMEIIAGCREAKLLRDCETLCSENRQGVVSCELRAAVLLPADPKYEISLPKVQPVLDLAVSDARSRGLLPSWLNLTFLPQDDHCDATYAQIGAFDSYSNCVHLFLGPACDYSVAAVGRVTKFLGAPLITTGGFTFDFTKKKKECSDEYYMTLRTGTLAFRDLSHFFIAIMDEYKWRKVHLLYDTNGQYEVAGKHTCQLMMKSMVEFVKQRQDFTYGTFDVETTSPKDYPEALRDHVGNTWSEPSKFRAFDPWRAEASFKTKTGHKVVRIIPKAPILEFVIYSYSLTAAPLYVSAWAALFQNYSPSSSPDSKFEALVRAR